MSDGRRRTLTLVVVLLVTAAATWWVWPRPAIELRVALGGRGMVVDRWGRTSPLPDTVFIAARGRNTRVRVVNEDTTYQTLGIFGAAANSSRNFSVPLPGVYGGFCSAHASGGTITYVVR
ncbi:MAG: hypothetical protein V4813_17065 [Gemmatimonadota bacterium]